MTDFEIDYRWKWSKIGHDSRPGEFTTLRAGERDMDHPGDALGTKIADLMGRLVANVQPHDHVFVARDSAARQRLSAATASDPLFAELHVEGDTSSTLLLMLREEPAPIGLLALRAGPGCGFASDLAPLYRQLADTLSRAVVNRRAQERLRERIKELTCLHGIARISRHHAAAPQVALHAIAQLLPPAMQWPDIAVARITIDDREYAAGPFSDPLHALAAPILIGGSRRGQIEVAYVAPHPEFVAGPFLCEERDLLASVAQEIALLVERTEAAAAQAALAEQLRHRDRLATIGQLAAGVAHELNEPLGNILGFAELLQKHPGLPEAAERDARQILHAALHGREIVRNLLLFARQSRTPRTRVDLSLLVRESAFFLEARCRGSCIELRLDMDERPTPIVADASQVTQVLVNLGMNAIQAMPDGGVLTLRTQATGDTVLLSIRDTGVGMDDRTQERLFTPFFTTKDVGEGTGLGLSVVLGIVSAHGGTIHVESAPGRGSCFEVRWPAAPRMAEEPE